MKVKSNSAAGMLVRVNSVLGSPEDTSYQVEFVHYNDTKRMMIVRLKSWDYTFDIETIDSVGKEFGDNEVVMTPVSVDTMDLYISVIA